MSPKFRPFVRNCVEVARVSPRKLVTYGDANRAIKRKACERRSHFQHKGHLIRGFHLIYHFDLSFTKNVIRFLNATYYLLVCLSRGQLSFDSLKASHPARKTWARAQTCDGNVAYVFQLCPLASLYFLTSNKKTIPISSL